MTTQSSIFSKRFNLLCLSSLLFFCSFNMIIPQLYDYLKYEIKGREFEGGILFAFTMIALISRPFSGKLVDRIGRVPVMIFGSAIACTAAFLYPLALTVPLFIGLRAFHGMSTGFKPTGSSAMIADIIPNDKRGEAMGYLGFMGSTGYGLGPFIGSTIYQHFGYNTMFFASGCIAFLSILVIINIKETLPKNQKEPFGIKSFKIKTTDIIEPKVLFPALVFLMYCLAYGGIYNLATNYGKYVFKVENIGWFFFTTVAASMLSRLVAGRVSDKKGRVPVLFVGLVIFVISTFILGFASSKAQFYFGGSIFGLAVGIISPSVYAWVTDLSDDKRKGRAFSTMYMAMEAGIGFGALFSSAYYNNKMENISETIFIFSIFPIIGVFLLVWKWKKYSTFTS